jgi:hypothetical protein
MEVYNKSNIFDSDLYSLGFQEGLEPANSSNFGDF